MEIRESTRPEMPTKLTVNRLKINVGPTQQNSTWSPL